MFLTFLGYKISLFDSVWLFFMGAVLTIGSIERTLKAGEGKGFLAGFYALLVSLSTWYSLRAAAANDCLAFGIFSAGTIAASVFSGFSHSKNKKE
jgi:hypothetical protein